MALKNSRSTKSKSSTKNNKKGSNLFMCFRPVELDHNGSGRVDPVVAYITLKKKDSIVVPAADEGVEMKEDGGDCTGKKGGGRRSFSNPLKAVNLFEVSMVG